MVSLLAAADALAALPTEDAPYFGQKIGTFSVRTGSKLRCSSASGDARRGFLKGAALLAGASNSAPFQSASFRHIPIWRFPYAERMIATGRGAQEPFVDHSSP